MARSPKPETFTIDYGCGSNSACCRRSKRRWRSGAKSCWHSRACQRHETQLGAWHRGRGHHVHGRVADGAVVQYGVFTMNEPGPQTPHPMSISVPSNQLTKRGCWRGCLVVLAIVLVPYLINALIVLGGSIFNQIKWRTNGSSNYTATVIMTALSPVAGESTITVQNGQIISGTNWAYDHCKGCSNAAQFFSEISIESMFERTYGCAFFFPWLTCSYEYDAQLGYPTKANVDCPIPDACLTHITVTNLQITPP